MKRTQSLRPRRLLLTLASPGVAVLLLFFALPLATVAWDALSDPGSFRRVFANPMFLRSLGGSAVLTLVAATASLVVGFCVALHLSRIGPRWRALLSFLIALPLTFSGLIVAYGFILAYGRAGLVTQLLGLLGVDPAWFAGILYSPQGLAFATSYYLIPRVVMLMLPVLVNFDRTQLAAAESLGATPREALLHVLLPQVRTTALTAFCLVAAVVFGAYGTALALVGTRLTILPLQLYSMVSESGSDFPAAAALALVLTGICSTVMAVGEVAAAYGERNGPRT
ncbi:ABC transporter permease subunit [Azospirillum sp. TSO22-1]|uniref:ABC transporter permease n=1 Tax=Azospirillum sp. TSO22-1 TaxID=716789 RepID=UPI001FFEDD15|nr:ABC transporter permease subunit [Azospirillum sp. TSO22-1]